MDQEKSFLVLKEILPERGGIKTCSNSLQEAASFIIHNTGSGQSEGGNISLYLDGHVSLFRSVHKPFVPLTRFSVSA